jgi:hypothetical protein
VAEVTSAGPAPDPGAERLAELRGSARGWHGIQLAVIGFVGLCGVLKDPGSNAPHWVQALAGYLALAALAVACAATYQIGRAAWPFYDVRHAPPSVADELERTSRRIRTGLALTFAAVALVALAALSSWWPTADEGGGTAAASVELEAGGATVCGTLAAGGSGIVTVVADGRRVSVPLDRLTGLRPC